MHQDPMTSTRTKAYYHWGHMWVVLSVVICIPRWRKAFSLPIFCRLYRATKVCERQGQAFFTKTQLGQQLVEEMAQLGAESAILRRC